MKVRSRCRTGCLTCRRRRKKCDESSYPRCKNCLSNKLLCTWPEVVIEAKNKKLSSDKDSLDDELLTPSTLGSNSSPIETWFVPTSEEASSQEPGPFLRQTNVPEISHSSESIASLNTSRTPNYFLQRIAMQQECVDDDAPVELVPISPIKEDIRSRIWNQLDVIVDADVLPSSDTLVRVLGERSSPSPLNT